MVVFYFNFGSEGPTAPRIQQLRNNRSPRTQHIIIHQRGPRYKKHRGILWIREVYSGCPSGSPWHPKWNWRPQASRIPPAIGFREAVLFSNNPRGCWTAQIFFLYTCPVLCWLYLFCVFAQRNFALPSAKYLFLQTWGYIVAFPR